MKPMFEIERIQKEILDVSNQRDVIYIYILTQNAKPKSVAFPASSWASVSVEAVRRDLDISKM